jgi:hypothetical protein
MQPSDDKIQKVKDSLYSRGGPDIRDSGRPELKQEAFDVATDWQDTTADMPKSPKKKKRSILKYVLIFSVLFFLLSVGAITYSLLSNSLTVSAKNVDISIVGPISIAAGTEASLDIVVTNNNATTLQDVNLVVEYPQGTRSSVDATKELSRDSISLGDLAPGQSVRKTISAVLFGEKDSIESIKTSVEYRIEGSSAIFNKDKSVDVSINSAPIILTVSNPTEITTSQNLSFTITVTSNATKTIDNLSLQAEYPFGFVFTSAIPTPTSGTSSLWRLGTIKPQETRTITVVGKLQGQSNDERTFRFVSGPLIDSSATQISAVYASASQTVAIKESSIGVAMLLGGSQENSVVTQAGKQTHASISWTNNLDTKIVNATIEAKLSGQMFDRTKVSTGGKGFYRSLDETVIWDKSSVPELAEISPGDKGNVGFDLATKAMTAGTLSAITDPRVTIDVTVKGTRFTTGGVPEQITSTLTRDMLVSSDIALTTRITHTTGTFENIGPIPPRVDQPTAYTVTWALTNTINDLRNVEVSALLPSYVKWTGVTLADGDVTFDEANSRVVWKPNSVPKGSGFSLSPRTASFQILLTPSNSQLGNEVVLILGPQATAKDVFTNTTLSSSQSDLTTRITTDPTYKIGDEIVTP